MTKTRLLALLSVLALLAAMPLAAVFAQQIPPQKFYGTVMIDGETPPEGTVVIAFVEQEVPEGEETITKMVEIGRVEVDAMGSYDYFLTTKADLMFAGLKVMFKVMVGDEEAQDANASVMMMMDDGSMTMMEESIIWTQGKQTQVDLELGQSIVRSDGTRGPAPIVGPRGPQGPAGPAGADGSDGADGARGPAGPAGADGADGADGARGPAGSAGADGSDGADGARGPAGAAGSDGAAGADGAQGPQGPAGAAGADGGGGALAVVALIIAIVGVVAAGGAFMAGRRG